jgi:hypothetical protein
MLIAASAPTAMPIGSTSHCTSKNQPTPDTTTTDARKTPTIQGMSALSSLRCILKASQICRRRALDAARLAALASFCTALL